MEDRQLVSLLAEQVEASNSALSRSAQEWTEVAEDMPTPFQRNVCMRRAAFYRCAADACRRVLHSHQEWLEEGEPATAAEGPTKLEQYLAWREGNPELMERLESVAAEHAAQKKHNSIWDVVLTVREWTSAEGHAGLYKLPNDFNPYIARDLIVRSIVPPGFFTCKKLQEGEPDSTVLSSYMRPA